MILERGDVVMYSGVHDYQLLGVILVGCVDTLNMSSVHMHTVKWLWRSSEPLSETDVIPRNETMGDLFMTRIGSVLDLDVDMAGYE